MHAAKGPVLSILNVTSAVKKAICDEDVLSFMWFEATLDSNIRTMLYSILMMIDLLASKSVI